MATWNRDSGFKGKKRTIEPRSSSICTADFRYNRYIGYVEGHQDTCNRKECERDVFDGFEIFYSFIIIYYSLFYLP